jgi:hypothetical protein
MYSLLPAIGAVSVIATTRLLQAGSNRNWLIWIGSNVVGLYVFYYLGFLTIAESLVLLAVGARLASSRSWLFAQSVVIAGFAPWLLVLGRRLVESSLALPAQTEVHLTVSEFIVENWRAFATGFTTPPGGDELIVLWAALAVVGVVVIARRSTAIACLLVSSVLVPAIGAEAILQLRPFFYPRFILFVLVPVWAVVAIGVVSLPRLIRQRSRALARVATALSVLAVGTLIAGNSWTWYQERTTARVGYAPDDYRAIFASLAERIRPGDLILGGYPWQAGYARAYFWRQSPRVTFVKSPTDGAALTSLVSTVSRTWVLTYSPDRKFAPDALETTLSARYPTVFVDQFGDSRVRLFAPSRESADVTPRVTFGREIGLQQTIGPSPTSVRAGTEVSEVLHWRALAVPAGDYTVFVHLIGRDGKLWGQVDSPPLRGFFPTKSWTPGLDLVDRYSIPIDPRTPPGTYDVEVGLYRPDSGQRMAVGLTPMPDNRVVVGSVTVLAR